MSISTSTSVNDLIEQNIDFARSVARGVFLRRGYGESECVHLQLADLESVSFVGLCEAAKRFDKSKGVPFQAFASIRIKGAILDYVRKMFPGQRLNAETIQKLDEAKEKLTVVPKERVFENQDFETRLIVTTDDKTDDFASLVEESAEEMLIKKSDNSNIRRVLNTLDDEEQLIIQQYFYQELTVNQLAQVRKLRSKSWICRQKARTLSKIKKRLNELERPRVLSH